MKVMVIDESTPLLPHQEIEKSEQSLEKRVENTPFSFKNTNAKNLNFFVCC